MTEKEAILHAKKVAEEHYMQGMLCHANPNDDKLDACIECAKEHEQLAEWLEELQQYRAIGTAEECREAMERKMPQKPKRKVLDKDLKIGNVVFKAGTRVYLCPSCEKGITGSDAHCRWCGQAILWEKR